VTRLARPPKRARHATWKHRVRRGQQTAHLTLLSPAPHKTQPARLPSSFRTLVLVVSYFDPSQQQRRPRRPHPHQRPKLKQTSSTTKEKVKRTHPIPPVAGVVTISVRSEIVHGRQSRSWCFEPPLNWSESERDNPVTREARSSKSRSRGDRGAGRLVFFFFPFLLLSRNNVFVVFGCLWWGLTGALVPCCGLWERV
jgi:hypothetical protein